MIIVFGSINLDMNANVKSFPQPGETVISHSYTLSPGGKGANQALAAARIGAKTALVGKVGDDAAVLRVLNYLKRHEVMTSGVAKSEFLPTGIATIFKDRQGENSIVVASGANAEVSESQVPTDILHSKNILLTQMEIPLEQNAIVMKRAYDTGAKVVLNLAPAIEVPKQLLMLVDYLIVNQIEARQLAKKMSIAVDQDAKKLALALAKEGKLTCIITMGKYGVVCAEESGKGFKIPALKIDDIADTTGAGDCFCGTFTACLHEGRTLIVAVKMAIVASGISCMTEGTMESYPYLSDIEERMAELPKAEAF
jgi:ribokinase